MSSVKMHISMDEEMRALVEGLAAREKRSYSELVREALRQYACSGGADRRAQSKAKVHAAIDRAAGAWTRESHPETLTLENYRRWRDELWALDQERLDARSQ